MGTARGGSGRVRRIGLRTEDPGAGWVVGTGVGRVWGHNIDFISDSFGGGRLSGPFGREMRMINILAVKGEPVDDVEAGADGAGGRVASSRAPAAEPAEPAATRSAGQDAAPLSDAAALPAVDDGEPAAPQLGLGEGARELGEQVAPTQAPSRGAVREVVPPFVALPESIRLAAVDGKLKLVKKWLGGGGYVDASPATTETGHSNLLLTACINGHA